MKLLTVSPNVICAKYEGDYFANTGLTGMGGSATVTLIYKISGSQGSTCNDISGLNAANFDTHFKITPPSGPVVVYGTKTYTYDPVANIGTLTIPATITVPSNAYSTIVEFKLETQTNSNYSINSNCTDNPLVTVSSKADGFVTGGGFIIPTNAGGAIGTIGVNGLKNNFGFNFKFNKTGKPQGNWNTIIRRVEGGTTVVYQVKSNVASSLIITKLSEKSYRADLKYTSANFQNLTCSLCPLDANNGTVIVSVYDNGEPGAGVDSILISIRDRFNNLWYTSHAPGNHSAGFIADVQLLKQGNIQIHTQGGPVARLAAPEITAILPVSFNIKAIPNPTTAVFEVQLQTDNSRDKMQLRVTDLTGRTVETFNNLKSGQVLRIGANYHSGIYIVELMQGEKRKQIKLVKL